MRGRVVCCTKHVDQVHTPTNSTEGTRTERLANGGSIHFTEVFTKGTLLPSREILRLNSKPSVMY